MLGAAQADTVGTQLAGYTSIAGRVSIGVNVHLGVLLGKVHHGSEVTAQVGIDSSYKAVIDLASATIDRNPVTFLIGLATHLDGAGLIVHLDFASTRYTALTHTTGNNGCVRGHTTTGGQDTLSNTHAAQVLGRGLQADHDHFLLARSPLLSIIGKEHNLTGCGTGACRQTLGHDLGGLNGGLVKHGVQQLIKLARLHALDDGLLVDSALAQQIHGDLHHSGARALTVTGLEQPQLAILDSELHVLHVVVVLLELLLDVNELLGALGHRLLKRGILGSTLFLADALQLGPTTAALSHDLLRSANTSHNVLALSINQILTIEQVLTSTGITREANASSTIVAHVAIDHGLNIDSSTILLRNLVHAAVQDGTIIVPAIKHGIDGTPELIVGISREILARVLLDSGLEANDELLEVIHLELCIKLHALLLFHVLDNCLKGVDVGLVGRFHAQHNVTIHLHKAAVAIPREPWIARLLGQCLGHIVVDTQVQDSVHHTRHRHGCTRANRYQLGIAGVVKLVTCQALDVLDRFLHIILDHLDNGITSLIIIETAHLGSDSETRRNGHTNQVHLGKVSTLATQQVSHVGTAFCLAVTKSVNRFHLLVVN